MSEKLQTLPIGTYHFEKLRRMNCLYVDKSARLMELVEAGAWYFLSRPRRFGKSLMLSTFDAMFQGKAELFKGLAAEGWVAPQALSIVHRSSAQIGSAPPSACRALGYSSL